MLITIPGLLNTAQVDKIHEILQGANFVDGRLTAGFAAARVKHNQELEPDEQRMRRLIRVIMASLGHNETFRYGALVGRIDGGDWFLLGTSFDAVVSATGRLFLAYWDSNAGDNFGSVTALISVNPSEVPEPGTLGLVGLALVGIASLRRRRE